MSIAGGLNVDILSYLFGSILSIKAVELAVSALLSITVILFVLAFHEELFSISFDEESAKVSGINVGRLNTALILLTSVTIVSSMGVVGLLLASSLIILPAASALQFRTSFRNTLILSAFFAVVSVVAGITLSYIFDFAASGTIVLLNALIFAGSYFCRECGKRWIG